MNDPEPNSPYPAGRGDIYTVSEIDEAIRQCLESEFPEVSVIGEIANFKLHSSGHCYLSLRDEKSMVRVVVFRRYAGSMELLPEDGMMAVATGRVSHYGGSGQTQIIARSLKSAGEGDLELEKRRLLLRLMREGLTDPERKRSLPEYPQCIAVVTSATGAVIRDIRRTIGRRWPLARISHFPVRVQGALAAGEIVDAFDRIERKEGIDAVILARGGGSAEDLWVFNSEDIARAVAGCRYPVVTGIGHEVDETVCDHISDVRAATPTAAAELVTPDMREVASAVEELTGRMKELLTDGARRRLETVEFLLRSSAFPSIEHALERSSMELDLRMDSLRDSCRDTINLAGETAQGMLDEASRLVEISVRREGERLTSSRERLVSSSPAIRIAVEKERTMRLAHALEPAIRSRVSLSRQELEGLARTVSGLGPQDTLRRGYAFCTAADGSSVIGSVEDIMKGEGIEVHFFDGEAQCRVEERRRRDWRLRRRPSRNR